MLYCPNFAVKELGKEFLSQVMSAYPACSNTLHMALLVQICRKGLCSNFISCCRYSPSRDWSTTMLFNFLATVSRGTSVLLFMSTHRGAPCMIIFMVMKMKPLVWDSLVFVSWYHSGMLDESNCPISKKKKRKKLSVIFFICPTVIRYVVMLYQLG